MTTNQEGRQAAIRSATSTVYNTSSDWHALFDQANIADGTFNERLLAWINQRLGASHTNISGAMYAYAANFSYDQWHSIATILLSDASQAVAGEANALSLDFTDSYFKDAGTSDFNGSAWVLDASTPANDYDGVPDDLLTYTQTTPKNVLNASGNLVYNAHNLYLNSASPANQSVTVVSGQTYKILVTGTVSVTASGAATGTATAGSPVSFTAATTTLTLGSTSGSGTVQVFATPADESYVATSGSAVYSLPYDHYTSGTLRGLLVEPEATNSLPYSIDFSNAAWALDATARATASVTLPDGTTGGYAITENSSTQRHIIYEAIGGIAGVGLFSVVAKNNDRDFMSLCLADTLNGYTAVFDLTNGTVTDTNNFRGTPATTDSGVIDLGNGWYRCWAAMTYSSSGTIYPTIGLSNSGTPSYDASGNPTYLGDGSSSIYLWHAQYETGTTPTSLIKTYGATATRAADNPTESTGDFPFSATNGTIFVEYEPRNVAAAYDAVRLDDGTANEVIAIGHDASANGELDVQDGGVGQTAPLTSGTVVADAVNRIAGVYAADDFALSEGGAAAATDTSGTLPTVTTMDIGAVNGRVRKIAYLPRRVTDAHIATWSNTGDLPDA